MLKKIYVFWLLVVLSSFLFITNPVQAKNNCLKLTAVANQDIAYKDRGDRCEGFYQSPVSAGSLELVGLMFGRLAYDLKKDKILHVVSPLVRDRQLHVQAVGIPMKTYYRLDTWLQPGETFIWPLDIVQKMSLRPDTVGLFAQLVTEPEIYVPLAVKGNAGAASQLILTLRASVDITSVQWRSGTLTSRQCGNMSKNGWNLVKPAWGDRFYSGVPITIPQPQPMGDFCIELAARTAGSGSWLKRLVKVRVRE